ncbi:MAG: phosphatase PAP2 family protein [Actinobacteria bacterium]|nr:phosphatase PAP2 family protein [Actinomycetota bacterium]
MPVPLITASWRRPAVVAVAVAVVVAVAMSVALHHGYSTSFDTWLFDRFYEHIGSTGARLLIDTSQPVLSFLVPAAVVGFAVWTRRWNLAVLAVVGPLTALFVSEVVLKPLVGRYIGPGVLVGNHIDVVAGSFPSGHETGVCSAAFVVLIALGGLRLRTGARIATVLVLAVWALLGAVGLVRNWYHYPTDTIGAVAVTTAVLLGVALLIDRVPRLSSPGVRSLASTSRGA